ncbi:glycoside hydrolase family 5 protein [Aspergillus udagawae]|uniref:Glycoside hydrolase family 5 domain-containing protein n=1 Tax=Aspergillus udagawae TaxID=91492 RepID=A0A8E0QN73_9EURO|nr:uncharacterized protein Aud_003864 [Aspergillus udagawae]GIC87480.1 hypothetical protein Aud_003864 [Aspergillus udagawae]
MATGFLRVRGGQIVDENASSVVLRGASLGGWMNMENFITGYPGQTFSPSDAKFFASLGLNCIRIPVNYRHVEDDLNPRVIRSRDQLALRQPRKSFNWWDHKDFQDRTIWLWQQIAQRYKENTWVAGYNPMNEPRNSEHIRLPAFYERFEWELRSVDPNHILFLDGNTFSMEWKGFEKVLPNSAYSIHDYSTMGLPTGEKFLGSTEQMDRLEKQFLRKAEFQQKKGTVLWNGEFGPAYEEPHRTPNAEELNKCRYDLLGAQLKIYDKYEISWSIWLYKDIGLQGMIYCDPESKYMKTVQDFADKKKHLNLDHWGMYPNAELDKSIKELVRWVDRHAPEATKTYPTTWNTERHIRPAVMQTFVADSFSMEFAKHFENMSEDELEECAKSFAFENCVSRGELNRIMSEHATIRDAASK